MIPKHVSFEYAGKFLMRKRLIELDKEFVAFEPAPDVEVTGRYHAGDSGDRDTPSMGSYIDVNTLEITGPIVKVRKFIDDYFGGMEGGEFWNAIDELALALKTDHEIQITLGDDDN
jgi:hypothetical protein